MFKVIELAAQLLLHPAAMSESFRRRAPAAEGALLLALILLAAVAYLTGLLGSGWRHALVGGVVTASGALLASAGFVVFVFLLHVNARIFGGDGRFVSLFSTLLILACALAVLVRLPLHLAVSLLPLTPAVVTANALVNALLLAAFIAYAIVAVRSVHAIPAGEASLALALIVLYAATMAAAFKVGLGWFAAS